MKNALFALLQSIDVTNTDDPQAWRETINECREMHSLLVAAIAKATGGIL